MAKKENTHSIEHQIINLEVTGIDDESEIKQLEQNFLYFYKERMGKVLNDLFDKLAPKGVHIQIDELVIDLGAVDYKEPADFERAFIKKAHQLIEKQLKKKMQKMRAEAKSSGPAKQKFTKMSLLEFFLEKGFYPSWASPENGTISDVFDELTSRNAKNFVLRIFKLRNNQNVRERLYQQFSIKQLHLLFDLIYKSNTTLAKKQMQVLKKRLGKQSEKAIVSAAINYALDGNVVSGTTPYNERLFTQKIIEEVQNRTFSPKKKTKVRAGFEGDRKDIQIIEYFLKHGAIPDWADVDSNKSLQELFETLLDHQLVPMQRMLERFIEQPNVVKRLIFQFPVEKVLQLLTPTPNENIQFIQNSIKDFEFLTSSRQNIKKYISTSKVKEIVLTEVLEYFFLEKKSKFIKKTFLKTVLESLATATQTEYTIFVKESYKSVRRKKKETAIRSTLESLDANLPNKLDKERKELRLVKKEYKRLSKSLKELLEKQSKSPLSASDSKELNLLTKNVHQLEKNVEELEDMDMPLEIEVLLKQRIALKSQLKVATKQEKAKLEKRLGTTEKEFLKLQAILKREVAALLANKKKLHTEIHGVAKYRIDQMNNRIRRHYRAANNVLQQFALDKKDLELFLADINRSLRGPISAEEKHQLRLQRAALQKEFIQLEEYIKELELQVKELEETLKSTLYSVDNEIEETVEKTGTSKLDALIFMLKYGSTPWWAEDLPRQSIEELFVEFATQNPNQLQNTLQNIGKYPVVWERIINQISTPAIKTVIEKIFPSVAKKIFAQARLFFTLHFSEGFKSLKKVDAKKFEWGIILEYLLSSKKTFNPQEFNKETILETARFYNLSPSKLIEYSNNIIRNNGDQKSDWFEWNQTLLKDKKVITLDREQLVQEKELQLKEEGIYLTDTQKLELLVEFISTGRITARAKEYKYDLQIKFEHLLLEQIQNNRKETAYTVLNLLRLSNARHFIINAFPEAFLWEIVHLIRPKAVLPAKRLFVDFEKIFADSKLGLEKDVLFNHLLAQQQPNFEAIDYIKAILIAKHQASGRQPLAILSEWKRKIKALNNPHSSWLASILMLEVDALKVEQKNIKDMDLLANLNERIAAAAKEYTDISTQLIDILSEELAEAQGIPDKEYKLTELTQLIKKHNAEIEALQKEIDEGEKDAFKDLETKRKIAQHVAQLKLLKQLRPPLLRNLEQQIEVLYVQLRETEQLLEEKAAKPSLEEVEQLLQDKAKKATLEKAEQLLQDKIGKATLEEAKKLLENKAKKTTLSKAEQLLKDTLEKTILSEAEQLLEDKIEKTTLEEAKILLENKTEKAILEEAEQLLKEKAENANSQKAKQLLDDKAAKPSLEAILQEKEVFEASLIERQLEVLQLLQKEAPDVLSNLPELLEDLKDEMHSHLSFFQELERIATSIKSTIYRTTLIQLLEKASPKVISLLELKQSVHLDQQQKALLQDIDLVAPIVLWKRLEELDDSYKENPSLLTPERTALQKQIRNAIQRRDQENLRTYAQTLQTAQNRVEKQLEKAVSLDVLEDLKEEIEVLWQQQQGQVDEMYEVARDEKTRQDFKRLRRNIDVIFIRLKNNRIRRSNEIVEENFKQLKKQETEQATKIKELEQQKELIIEEVERKEAPVVKKKKKKRRPKAAIPLPVQEPLQIYNAGMVLIWPFVSRLFDMLGYVKNKNFVSEEAQHKAIHILQYLVTGKTEAPENELVLNKILCNYPVTSPVPFSIEFDPNELQAAESLLGGVIKNWAKMKNMTPNSLRGSFLIREGSVTEEEEKWNLVVERKTFDILLKSVPWSFSFIKFSWLEKFLNVEWKLM